jgi:AcrR family transcriptional regulator
MSPALAPMPENPTMAPSGRTGGGLRERKKQRTRDSIQRVAMRLFLEQGYEATTIEQIADAVEISPSTFFNYFPSKEEVVFADDFEPLVARLFLDRPRDEPMSVALRHALMAVLPGVIDSDRDLMLARGRLALQTPALKGRLWQDLEKTQDLVRTLIAERTGRDPEDFELRVVAGALVGALYAAVMEWTRQDGRADMMDLLNRALDTVENGARIDPTG